MAVEDSPAGSHDDESKPISKRLRLLQKHCVEVPVEEAIRAEITSCICNVKQMVDENPLLFWKINVQFNTWKKSQSTSLIAVKCMFSTMGLILHRKRSRISVNKANAILFIHDSIAFLDMV